MNMSQAPIYIYTYTYIYIQSLSYKKPTSRWSKRLNQKKILSAVCTRCCSGTAQQLHSDNTKLLTTRIHAHNYLGTGCTTVGGASTRNCSAVCARCWSSGRGQCAGCVLFRVWNVCVCIFCLYDFVCTFVFTLTDACICLWICINEYVNVYKYIRICIYMCIYIYIYVSVYIDIYTHICIFGHLFRFWSQNESGK